MNLPSPNKLLRSSVVSRAAVAVMMAVGVLLAVSTFASETQTFQGKLIVSIADQESKAETESYSLLGSDGNLVPLDLQGNPNAISSGSEVTVKGSLIDGRIKVADSATAITLTNPAPPAMAEDQLAAAPPASRKTIAILVNPRDHQEKPYTAQAVREALFTSKDSANQLLQAASFGRVSLTGKYRPDGDVVDWLPVDGERKGDCVDDSHAIANQALREAGRRGVDTSGYDHVIFVMPYDKDCSWTGYAQMNGRRSWTSFLENIPSRYVLSHELMHNLGANHANSVRCRQDGHPVSYLREASQFNRNCTITAYGDPFDLMGNGRVPFKNPYHPSAYHKTQAGWLPPQNKLTIEQDGVYTIAPLEKASDKKQIIRLPFMYSPGGKVVEFLHLDYRQPDPTFDTFQKTDPVARGISLYTGLRYQTVGIETKNERINRIYSTLLLDMRPETETLEDAPLTVGKTYREETSGISITLRSQNSAGATIEVRGLTEFVKKARNGESAGAAQKPTKEQKTKQEKEKKEQQKREQEQAKRDQQRKKEEQQRASDQQKAQEKAQKQAAEKQKQDQKKKSKSR